MHTAGMTHTLAIDYRRYVYSMVLNCQVVIFDFSLRREDFNGTRRRGQAYPRFFSGILTLPPSFRLTCRVAGRTTHVSKMQG